MAKPVVRPAIFGDSQILMQVPLCKRLSRLKIPMPFSALTPPTTREKASAWKEERYSKRISVIFLVPVLVLHFT